MGQRTIAMREKMPLQLGLLRKRLIRTMTALPATIVAIPFGPVDSGHMARNEMFLQSTGVRKAHSTRRAYPAGAGSRPLAHERFAIHGREVRTGDHGRRPTV